MRLEPRPQQKGALFKEDGVRIVDESERRTRDFVLSRMSRRSRAGLMGNEGDPARRQAMRPARSTRRLALWPIVTLGLMFASFAAGRLTGAFHSLPALVATLPGDESEFSREFDERMRERFPVGASEEALIAYLAGEKFRPEWRRRDDANASAFVWSGLLCTKIIRVSWRADAAGLLEEVSGSYESSCL
jgi:hypothetical protein